MIVEIKVKELLKEFITDFIKVFNKDFNSNIIFPTTKNIYQLSKTIIP